MRKYKGYTIREWSGPYGETPDAGEPRWYIESRHEATGLTEFPSIWMRFRSLRAVKERINYNINQQEGQ